MIVKELAEHFNCSPAKLSSYIEENYNIVIPPIDNYKIDDYLLRKISHTLYTQEKIKSKVAVTNNLGNAEQRNSFLNHVKHNIKEAIKQINSATEQELYEYEKDFNEYFLNTALHDSRTWDAAIELMKIKWNIVANSLHQLSLKKKDLKFLEQNKEKIKAILDIFFVNCTDADGIIRVIETYRDILDSSFTETVHKATAKFRNTNHYDITIEAMKLKWPQMIDFLIKANNKYSVYVVGRNLLCTKIQKKFQWEYPTLTKIKQTIRRILKECTLYPEIDYIVNAMLDACNSNMNSYASECLENNRFSEFWNYFNQERNEQIRKLKINAKINDCYVIKVEKNYLLVRMNALIGSINKFDLSYSKAKDLNIFFKKEDRIQDLLISDIKTETYANNNIKYKIILKSNLDFEKNWESYVKKYIGKPRTAEIVNINDRGAYVVFERGVEGFIKKENMSFDEYKYIADNLETRCKISAIIQSDDSAESVPCVAL